MVGIKVTTGVRVGPSGTNAAPASTLFLAGSAVRGPVNRARLVLGMSQFESIYGPYSSSYTLWDNVKTFFEEGGTRCYVVRAMGATRAAATVNVTASGGATVLTLTAANPGTWANTTLSPLKYGLSAVVAVSGSEVTVTIKYQNETIWAGGPYSNETLADGSTKYAKQAIVEAINSDPALTELIVATVGPSTDLPAAATYDLISGTESAPVTADLVTALDLFDYDLGAGAVALPGQYGSTAWNGLRDHAKNNRRIALCAHAVGTSKATAITEAKAYWGSTAASRTDASYMAFFWPSVKVPDGFGSTRDQSPEAYVAAARCRAHLAGGPWRVGAGAASAATYVTGLYEQVSRTAGDDLDNNRINALRVIDGAVRVYGARSISADEANWRFITYRDTLNYITAQAEAALEPLVFSPIDGRGNLFGQIEAILTGLVDPIRAAGGLYEGFSAETGAQIDRGYSVEVSSSINSTATLSLGQVNAVVGARVSPVADKINIRITKSALTSPV